nr:NADH dehydrogenase subunit 9 [Haplopteris ensiformis]UQV94664.1 NADH dehydrogenase subunit 9 [Haplopteris ensiformis]UQV94677.1 NADH dehydrogenase subunit 9 [Haplopteris ensiformis]UQV94679.1 NADH dehydrogenase subunit 9 [Haplopteris ensiformis]UQV94698.1 NADH dehydrogenase subunit 9 [Haplopteris ensiformis]
MTHNLPRSSAVVTLVPKWIHRIEHPKQESTIYTTPEHLFDLLVFFRCHTNTRFGILIDICGVDYPSREQRLRVIYQLLTIQYKSRVCIKIGLNEITLVSSVISIFPSAGWWEREVWDMFGIRFSNYPELRRILTDYGFESHPLRKDFPLSGYVEVRYDDLEKRVISERLEMAQEFRYFDLTSPWKLTPSRHLSTKIYSFLVGRWRSRRAMNPVDHPHGGGEGRTKGGRPSVSPWGIINRIWIHRINLLFILWIVLQVLCFLMLVIFFVSLLLDDWEFAYCASSEEGSNSVPDDALSGASFGERWSDHTYDLTKVASSLEKEGIIRFEHLKELKSVGNGLIYTEIPDLDEVVHEAARERLEKYGSDPVAAHVTQVLSNLNVARNAAEFLQNGVEHLVDQQARASQLSQILNGNIIPTINNVIVSYKQLREAAVYFESDSAENSMDSDADSGKGDV